MAVLIRRARASDAAALARRPCHPSMVGGAFIDAHMMARLHPDRPRIGTRRDGEAEAV